MSPFSEIVPVPCHWGVRDNYSYLCVLRSDPAGCIVVDACEPEPVLRALSERSLSPRAILSTHHHWDHIGANETLVEHYGIDVFGHHRDRDRIPRLTQALAHGDTFDVGGVRIRLLHVPGHTQGSVVYAMEGTAFTGDTLFCGGCGRLLEGTAEQLQSSLTFLAEELPGATRLHTGHEYAISNLKFALQVLHLPAIEERLLEVVERREAGECCAIASMEEELATNLFLLCHLPDVQRAVLGARLERVPAERRSGTAFAELRARKDRS